MFIIAAVHQSLDALVDKRFAIDARGREFLLPIAVGGDIRAIPDIVTSELLRSQIKCGYALVPTVLLSSIVLTAILGNHWLLVATAMATWFAVQVTSVAPLARTLERASRPSAAKALSPAGNMSRALQPGPESSMHAISNL